MSDILNQLKNRLGTAIVAWDESHAGKVYIDLDGLDIVGPVDYLFKTLGCRFITATATDMPEGIELLYHFTHDATGVVISLRVLITDKQNPAIESISSLFTGSHWIEREIHEMMGVTFTGNPRQADHLLLGEDWPAGVYPQRRDYQP